MHMGLSCSSVALHVLLFGVLPGLIVTSTWKRCPARRAAWRVDRPDLRLLRTDLNLEKNRIRDDLNSERNRMRDGLQGMRDKANELEIKMDKETNALRAAVEQSKNEVRMSYVAASVFNNHLLYQAAVLTLGAWACR